jgi:hypothetical protein
MALRCAPRLRIFARAWILLSLAAPAPTAAQQRAVDLKGPQGPGNAVVSPDGAYGLFWGPLGLSIDDRHTHGQQFVMIVAAKLTATMAWSPDSAAFVVNHRVASDLEIAYLFDAKTLDQIDLGGRIAAADPELKRFIPEGANSPGSHFHAWRWLDAGHVLVEVQGHTVGQTVGNAVRPGECYGFRYSVSRTGEVRKLGGRAASLDSQVCESIENAFSESPQ